MAVTISPAHIAVQSFAASTQARPQQQAPAQPRPQPAPDAGDGFESLVIKPAQVSRVIEAAKPNPAAAASQARPATPDLTTASQQQPAARGDDPPRPLRPGTRLDIRV
jgi:hypothetical protein